MMCDVDCRTANSFDRDDYDVDYQETGQLVDVTEGGTMDALTRELGATLLNDQPDTAQPATSSNLPFQEVNPVSSEYEFKKTDLPVFACREVPSVYCFATEAEQMPRSTFTAPDLFSAMNAETAVSGAFSPMPTQYNEGSAVDTYGQDHRARLYNLLHNFQKQGENPYLGQNTGLQGVRPTIGRPRPY